MLFFFYLMGNKSGLAIETAYNCLLLFLHHFLLVFIGTNGKYPFILARCQMHIPLNWPLTPRQMHSEHKTS